jgi:hypothetical protein
VPSRLSENSPGNLTEQVGNGSVQREDGRRHLGYLTGRSGGDQVSNELAADPLPLPRVFYQHSQFGGTAVAGNEGG